MAQKLTVVIPCKNETHNIAACIQSVRSIADEILVADSLSTDDTLDIVEGLGGCRVIRREFRDFANFNNWAIPQASHPWVLLIHADERLTDELADEIREILANDDPPFDAYSLRRDNYFLGGHIRHCGWNTSRVPRLFRRECRYGPVRVHECLTVPADRIGRLRGKYLHYTGDSVAQYTEKQNRYTTFWAEDQFAAGRRATGWDVLLRPPARFLQLYLLRGGFLDGAAGLIVCMGTVVYVFLKYAKLWELSQTAGTKK
jgi:glycosyltransferase involved in cell wall biosynthesis